MPLVKNALQFLNRAYEKRGGKPVMEEFANPKKAANALAYFLGDILLNPDPVLFSPKAFGKGLRIYQDMQNKDPEIGSCARTRKKAVVNKPWDVLPISDKRRDVNMADFAKWSLIQHRWGETRFEALDCVFKGFSVLEIMWGIANWHGSAQIIPVDIKARDPFNYGFDADHNLLFRSRANPMGEPVPPRKFLVLRNEPYAQNPYGSAVLKEIFWYWYFKKLAVNWQNIFMEKFATPTTVATYPSSNMSTDQTAALQTAIETISNATAIRVPEGITVDFLEAKRRGIGGYMEWIKYCDGQFAKTILGQTLSSDEGQRVGSLALGKVHAETRYEYTADDSKLLDSMVNYELIPWIIDFNFANVTEYPQYKTHHEPDEDLLEEAKRDETLIAKVGLRVGEDYMYKKYNIPPPEEGKAIVEPPRKGGPPGFSAFADKNRIKGWKIASTLKIEDKYAPLIKKIILSLGPEYIELIKSNQPLRNALDGLLRQKFQPEMEKILGDSIPDSIVHGARSMANRLKITINEGVYTELMESYFKRRAYEKGTISQITTNLRDLLAGKAEKLLATDLSIADVTAEISRTFPELATWKAKQIAKTEVLGAADWAGTQMVKRSGIPVDAWFVIDPASCATCQEWAAESPYTLTEAETMGLPHPQCNDVWQFTPKGGR